MAEEKRRRGRPPNPAEEQIIEAIRGLLRINQTRGDIVRMVVANKNFGIESARQVGRYMRLARARNKQAISRSEDEALSDSIGLWASKQRDAQQAIGKARQSIDYHTQRIRECETVIDDPDSPKEKIEIALIQQQRSVQQMDDARRTVYGAERTIIECQDRIDRLLGNFAPVKVARTDTKGRDVAGCEASQPATHNEAKNRVEGILETLKSRIGNEGN